MADVYRHSYLTVAPAWADSPHLGCFAPPENGGVEVGPIIVSKRDHFPSSGDLADTCKHLPLFSRAWVYQERLIPPRTLYLSRHEMLWECREGRSCECGGAGVERDDFTKLGFHDITSHYSHDRHFLGCMWRIIVIQYSGLQLTYVSDKLAALAGIAAEIHRGSGQEYVAGLWRDTLLLDMCWFVNQPERRNEDAQPTFGQSSPHRAPSWSWASIGGAVSYPAFVVYGPYSRTATLLSRVVDIQPTSLGSFHVQGPQRGFLELHCLLLPARFEPSAHTDAGVLSAGGFSFNYIPDTRHERREEDQYYVIPLVWLSSPAHERPNFWGIVVRSLDGTSENTARIAVVHESDHDRSLLNRLLAKENEKMTTRIF